MTRTESIPLVELDVFRAGDAEFGPLCVSPTGRCVGEGAAALGFRTTVPSGRARRGSLYRVAAVLFHRRGSREVALREGSAAVASGASDGTVSLIPAGWEIRPTYLEPCEGLVVGLSGGLLGEVARSMGAVPAFQARAGLRDPVLSGLCAAAWEALRGGPRLTDALGRALATHLLEAYPADAPPPPPWFRRAEAYLDARLAGPVTVDDLAAAAGLSRSHFCRLFRKVAGRSPHAFIVERRVGRVCQRLRADPSASLADLAAEAGFCDQSHLTAHFRRLVGTTPAAYRATRATRA